VNYDAIIKVIRGVGLLHLRSQTISSLKTGFQSITAVAVLRSPPPRSKPIRQPLFDVPTAWSVPKVPEGFLRFPADLE